MNKNFKKIMNMYQYEIFVGILSIVAIIIGSMAIGFLTSFLIVGIIDLLLIVPSIINNLKPVKGKHVQTTKEKKNTIASTKKRNDGIKVIKKKDSEKEKSTEKFSDIFKDKKDDDKIAPRHKKEKKEKEKNPKKKKSWFKRILIFFLLIFIILIITFILFMFYIVVSAPKFDPNNLYRMETSILYDKDGKEWARLGTEKREKVKYKQLPNVLVDAVIATEDSRFFEHNGFDLPRFLKASFGQLLGHDAGGASTLTMQVSKNNYTSTTASGFEGIKRKFTDIYMSIFQIERKYTKEEIIEFYVNQPYLGSGTYGVEQACQTYFGKSVSDINVAEAALIAGLFQAPNAYDPYIHPDASEQRRETVLYLMRRHGYINKDEYNAAMKLTVNKLLTNKTSEANKYQAFLDTVIEDVEEKTGNSPYDVGMKIYTTLDSSKQEHIDSIMSGESYYWENPKVNAGISVIDSKTGAVVAIGAGRDRSGERSYNTATMIKRQIGSTAKPLYDYAMGFEKKGWSTYQPFADEPHSYSNGVSIDNWNRNFQGWMTLRRALAESRNIPALKAFQANKTSDIKDFVESIGLSPEYTEDGIMHEAHALGGYNGESPLSLSAAYSTFASGGYYTKPFTFTKIVYRENDKTFEPDTERKKVLSAESAYMMNSVLLDAATWGIGTNTVSNGAKFAAKTGTSNFSEETKEKFNLRSDAVNDLWVAGYSPDYTIAIWYGYNKINSDYVSTASTGEHRRLFLAVANGIFKSGSSWTKPSGVVSATVENYTYPAKLASGNTPGDLRLTELFKKGSEPTEVSSRFTKLGNVKNVRGSVNGNTVSISWDGVSPASYNTSWVSQVFSDSGYANSFIGSLNAYNRSHLGEFGYKVYAKQGGSLSLIKFVTSNSIKFDVAAGDASTYIIKSAYSISSSLDSSGVEVNVDLSNIKSELSAELIGEDVKIPTDYNYSEGGYTAYENGNDITNKTSVSITISDQSGNTNTTNNLSYVSNYIKTDKENVYTITYKITYKGETIDTLTRKVTVSE